MLVREDEQLKQQNERNNRLLDSAKYLGERIESGVIPFDIDLNKQSDLTTDQKILLKALEIQSARTAIKSLASLATIGELDHLGGGLDLISAFILTLALTDYEKVEYTIEHAHTSIGYFSALSAFGFLAETDVIDTFRRGLDIAGHVSWVPGGTQLNGGRLGVMIPVAVGQALGKRAIYGEDAWVITHCGDAGWISGQALNGFNGADLHHAPITFVMHRNGIQLSGSNKQIMDKDPRPIISSLGIKILEIPSLHEPEDVFRAYKEARSLARNGIPSLIYPVGYSSDSGDVVDLSYLGNKYGVSAELTEFAQKNNTPMNTKIWIPGSLMSYRDIQSMFECIFLVNDLEGGKGHHDGHMKGRDVDTVLKNPMLVLDTDHQKSLETIRNKPKKTVITNARPAPGSENLVIPQDILKEISLPEPGKSVSPRAGVDVGYAAVARAFPEHMFIVSCDLDPSTKLGTARKLIPRNHSFEMSIEEQVSALIADGLAMSSDRPQLNVFSTFAAFYEGIAREGFELWRYQRNLNGINEGLNVTMHLSHVGACTGRDHFSGWSLDWINLALGYLPYLHRFYAPADARAAFVAVRDLAAHYGGHIIGVPRDNLPVLTKADQKTALWDATSPWESMTLYRSADGAKKAILALGAPAFLAGEAFQILQQKGEKVDVYVVNGFPLEKGRLNDILSQYSQGIVTIEDGIIGSRGNGLSGFAGYINGAAYGTNVPLKHLGITDPRIAPSQGHLEVWKHFGLTAETVVTSVKDL